MVISSIIKQTLLSHVFDPHHVFDMDLRTISSHDVHKKITNRQARPMPNRAVNNQYRPQSHARVNSCVTEKAVTGDTVLVTTSPPAAINCCMALPPNVIATNRPIDMCNEVLPTMIYTDCTTESDVDVNVSKVEVEKEVINLAQLKYVNITIDGMNQCVRSLADGGAELSVINAKLLHDIEYVSL